MVSYGIQFLILSFDLHTFNKKLGKGSKPPVTESVRKGGGGGGGLGGQGLRSAWP